MTSYTRKLLVALGGLYLIFSLLCDTLNATQWNEFAKGWFAVVCFLILLFYLIEE